jgi:hypothetical protein
MSKQQPSKPSSLKFWVAASLLVIANATLAASFWPFVVKAAHNRADQLVIEAQQRQGSEAQLDFKIAQMLDPANQRAAATVAASLLAQEQPERALVVLNEAIRHGAGEAPAMRSVAVQALLETGSIDSAVAQADALAPVATTPDQLLAVALAYAVGEKADQLATYTARLSASEPARRVITLASSKLALAQELYNLGLLKASQHILDQQPASLPRQLLLGSLHEHYGTSGDLTQARTAYTDAIALDPASHEARQGLIRVLQAQHDDQAVAEQTRLLQRLEDGRP